MKKHEYCIPETNTIARPIAEIIGSTDGGTGKYIYEDTGIKCPSNISTTLKSDVSADKWLSVASKPILNPFDKPLSSFLQPTSLYTGSYNSNTNFLPDISVPNNVPNFNFISNSNNVSSDSKKVTTRYESLQKGFTGQVLGGAVHDERHKRDYSEKPNVNKEVLNAARKIDRDNNAGAVNFMLFHDHYLTDDDMYWISSMFNTHKDKLAVNMLDLSNNSICLAANKGMPFFSFNYPFYTSWNLLRLDLSNNNIGDHGAKCIAEGLSKGFFPITKMINLSGNKITENVEDDFINALKQPIVQDIIVILKRAYDVKTVISGSKEAKQRIIKEILYNAQDNGVDIKNVAVSKGLGEFIWNNIKIGLNFSWGFTKCNIIPEDAKSFAAERIIAKISKKAFAAYTAKDAVVCFFDTIGEVSISPEGIQLIKDLDLVGANALIDSIE